MRLDEIDRKIVGLLRDNARTSNTDLARRLAIPRTTVQNRIERMERYGVIGGYTLKAGADYERGFIAAHVLITASSKLIEKAESQIRALPEVRKLYTVTGSYDLIAIVAVPSIGEMDDVLHRIGTIAGVERTLSAVILATKIDR